LTTKGIELYPRQNYLPGEHVGSLVRLPFGKHLKTGKFYGFIDLEGHDLAERRRDQLALIAKPQRVSQDVIDGILAAAPEIKPTFQLTLAASNGIRQLCPGRAQFEAYPLNSMNRIFSLIPRKLSVPLALT